MFNNEFKKDEEDMIEDELSKFMFLVLEENKKINLTSITDEKDFKVKHFEDSLLPTKVFDFNNKVIGDLGSGAGFPGIPLALKYPSSTFYLIEPTLKKCNFLNKACKDLEINNVKVINSRFEELSKDFKFDCIVTRAVSSLSIILELAIPFLKKDGILIVYKSLKGEEEIIEATNALNELSSSILNIQKDTLSDGSKRVNIFIQKNVETKENYPRPYSQIKKHPL